MAGPLPRGASDARTAARLGGLRLAPWPFEGKHMHPPDQPGPFRIFRVFSLGRGALGGHCVARATGRQTVHVEGRAVAAAPAGPAVPRIADALREAPAAYGSWDAALPSPDRLRAAPRMGARGADA